MQQVEGLVLTCCHQSPHEALEVFLRIAMLLPHPTSTLPSEASQSERRPSATRESSPRPPPARRTPNAKWTARVGPARDRIRHRSPAGWRLLQVLQDDPRRALPGRRRRAGRRPGGLPRSGGRPRRQITGGPAASLVDDEGGAGIGPREVPDPRQVLRPMRAHSGGHNFLMRSNGAAATRACAQARKPTQTRRQAPAAAWRAAQPASLKRRWPTPARGPRWRRPAAAASKPSPGPPRRNSATTRLRVACRPPAGLASAAAQRRKSTSATRRASPRAPPGKIGVLAARSRRPLASRRRMIAMDLAAANASGELPQASVCPPLHVATVGCGAHSGRPPAQLAKPPRTFQGRGRSHSSEARWCSCEAPGG